MDEQEKQEKTVRHVTDESKGPLDGVELDVNCIRTQFRNIGKTGRGTMKQSAHPAKILASYETGVVSISVRDRSEMISVRLDEMMFLLSEAAKSKLGQDNKKKTHVSSEVKADGKG